MRFHALGLSIVFLAFTSLASAQPVPQWGRWEKSFEAKPKTDPDPTIGLIVRLTSPHGKIHKVSAFWDGGKIWRVRFMPDEPGKWRFRTIAYPDYAGLNAQRGSFTCRKVNGGNRFALHGAVKVTRDGENLKHVDGSDFVSVGEVTPITTLRMEGKNPNIRREYSPIYYSKTFTVIRLTTTSQLITPGNAENEIAFTGDKKIRINPNFFKLLDDRINAINAHGRLAILDFFGKTTPSWNLPEDQIILLEKYLVARYGAHHVAWLPDNSDDDKSVESERSRRIFKAVFGDKHNSQTVLLPYQYWQSKLKFQ